MQVGEVKGEEKSNLPVVKRESIPRASLSYGRHLLRHSFRLRHSVGHQAAHYRLLPT